MTMTVSNRVNQCSVAIDCINEAHGLSSSHLSENRSAIIFGEWMFKDGNRYQYRLIIQAPDKLYWQIEQIDGGEEKIVNVLSGSRAWCFRNAEVMELDDSSVSALLDVHFRSSLIMMINSLSSFCYHVENFDDHIRKAFKNSFALKLSGRFRRDLIAHFDRDTYELLGYDSFTRLPGSGRFMGEKLLLECVAGDYIDLRGNKRAASLEVYKNGELERVNHYHSLQLFTTDQPEELFKKPEKYNQF